MFDQTNTFPPSAKRFQVNFQMSTETVNVDLKYQSSFFNHSIELWSKLIQPSDFLSILRTE